MKIKVGYFFHARKLSGGIFQYSVLLLEALAKRKDALSFDVVVFYDSPDFPLDEFNQTGLELVNTGNPLLTIIENVLPDGIISYCKAILSTHEGMRSGRRSISTNKRLHAIFKSYNIDVVIYPSPRREVFEANIPAITVIHDIQHRLQPEFPEVSKYGEYARREYLYQNTIERSVALIAESDIGRDDIINEYQVSGKNIYVLPYIPPIQTPSADSVEKISELRKKYNLPDRFIFYPAQFWPHKNHFRLVQAIHKIHQEKKIRIPVLFVGSQQKVWKEFQRVFTYIKRHDLSHTMRYLDYVHADEIPYFYRLATMLVMPTFFGPTNIPVLEAFAMGCPVVTSDIRGIREQVGKAAELASPTDVDALASKILLLWTNEKRRKELISLGLEKSRGWTMSEFSCELQRMIEIIVKSL